MRKLAAGAALTVLASTVSTAAYAQATTGAIRGRVINEGGEGVAAATVTVTHVPTGSTATSITDADGFYSVRGLRPGGPYRVNAQASGMEPGAASVPAIGLGEPANVEVPLFASGSQVSELVVTAAAQPNQGGPATNFSESDIQALPSISRDLKDVARLDPFATIDPTNQDALSFAGSNTRFNQLTVDGVRQNDDFGLNNNGYPTQRSPISLDAVEAVNVSAAPFSVINNGFVGGQINAVTKSGGNRFHGSGYYEYTGRDLQGKKIEGVKTGSSFKEEVYGVTLGGPILKDRLFFFGAYEKFKGTLGFDEGPADSGASISIPRITTAAVNTFQADTKRIYGYDPGNALTGDFPVADEKWLGKLDWNITDNHRASFTYQNTKGNSLNGSVLTPMNQANSVTQPRIGLSTHQYNKTEELTAYTVQLNSDWTENFSTELRYNKKETETSQIPLGGLSVGEVTVNVDDLPGVLGPAGSTPAQIRFGADQFRHDNYLLVKLETWEAIARYRYGSHELLLGARTEKDDLFNVFVSGSLGVWTFNSYADFLARRAAAFTLSGGIDPTSGTIPATLGTARAGAAKFGFRLSSLYAEDRLQVTDDFDITAGVRFDWYAMSDTPVLNTAFVSRQAFTNRETLDGKYAVLPRVSFNWRPTERLDVSGGFGRFSSTGLNVWISNAFSNTGVSQTSAACPAAPFTNVSLTQVPAGCAFTPRSGEVNALAPSFKIPTVWKFNLSVGYDIDLGRFGDNWRVQADYLQTVNENALYWYDARAVQTGVAPDGRPVYSRSTAGITTGNTSDFLLSNLNKGGAQSAAFTIGKEWDQGVWEGLGFRYTYTYTDAEDANPMTSSIAQSSYTRFGTSDPQRPPSATSDYEVRNRHALEVYYQRKFFGDNKTSLRLFAQHRSGLPFSYTFARSRTGTFDNDFGYNVSSYSGLQATSNALLYVPTANDPRVVYAPGFDQAAFMAFLKNSGLAKYAGGIAPRNAFRQADVSTIDLRFSQELPVPYFPGGAKVELFMDVENLGNLINDKWGVLEQYDFSRAVPVVNVDCVGASGALPAINCGVPGARYRISGTGAGDAFQEPVRAFRRQQSLWQIKFGAKFKF